MEIEAGSPLDMTAMSGGKGAPVEVSAANARAVVLITGKTIAQLPS